MGITYILYALMALDIVPGRAGLGEPGHPLGPPASPSSGGHVVLRGGSPDPE